MKPNALMALLVLFVTACQAPPVEEYAIIPQPCEITYTPGIHKMDKEPAIGYPAELSNEAVVLKSVLLSDFKMESSLNEGKDRGDILLQLDPTILPDKPEGYVMDVTSGKIEIKANSAIGVMNGIQTLRQIMKEKDGRYIVQRATVTDYPAFSWRAFMLDEGRYFKGKQVVKDLLDEMALLKMNVFHWHLTDDQGWRIEIKKYPKLTEVGAFRDSTEINHFHSEVYDGKSHGGFYTQDDIKEIVAYADKYHIQVVPEIEMPGHASAAIAAYPWLGVTGKEIKVSCRFGVQYDVFNIADPKVIEFLEDVVSEVVTLFPSPVIHIGGDEVRYNQWNESRQVQDYMEKNGLKASPELQVFFTNHMSNFLVAKGKRMMGWNEITGDQLHDYQTEASTDVNQQLAKSSVVQFWKGDPQIMLKTIKKGYDVVNSYHEYTYLDYKSITLAKAYEYNPIPADLPVDLSHKVLGAGCQMWCEFVPTVENLETKVYPRLAAFAECGWTNPANKDYPRFLKSLEFFKNRWIEEGIVIGSVGNEAAF